MRLLGIVALIAGVVGTARAVPAALGGRRPADLAWALAAPVAVLMAVLGAVALVCPDALADGT
jgi:hypothetical protein